MTCSTTPRRARRSCSTARCPADKVWDDLPVEFQKAIIDKKIKLLRDRRLRGRPRRRAWASASTRSCRPASSPSRACCPRMRRSRRSRRRSRRPTSRKGEEVVQKNFAAVDHTLAHLHEVKVPATVTATKKMPPIVSDEAPDFVKRVTRRHDEEHRRPAAGFGLPGRWHLAAGDDAVGKAKHRHRNPRLGKPTCASSATSARWSARTPRSAPRSTNRRPSPAPRAPSRASITRAQDFKGQKFTIQVAPEDCTGCRLCVNVCPAKDKTNPEGQGHQHGRADPAPRAGEGELQVLPRHLPSPIAPSSGST